MWMIDPHLLCRKHLLGEHTEMHLLVGSIAAGKSIQGYLDNGLINTSQINERHDALAVEMTARGMSHKSPLAEVTLWPQFTVNVDHNMRELARRCPTCRARMEIQYGLEKFADIPLGGDKVFEADEGVWKIKVSGKVLDGEYTTRTRAVQAIERARRELLK